MFKEVGPVYFLLPAVPINLNTEHTQLVTLICVPRWQSSYSTVPRTFLFGSPSYLQSKHCCSTSGTLVVSQTNSGSLKGHLRTNFFRNGYAHTARTRSKPSRRRSSWGKPHLFGCPVCVELSELTSSTPIAVTGRAATISSREASGKTVSSSLFSSEKLGKNHSCTSVFLIRDEMVRGDQF